MLINYSIRTININRTKISKLIIDDHFKLNHGESISEHLIIKLVFQLDGRKELPESTFGKYMYFVNLLEQEEKQYRLVWLLEKNKDYIGVINAYRDDRKR